MQERVFSLAYDVYTPEREFLRVASAGFKGTRYSNKTGDKKIFRGALWC